MLRTSSFLLCSRPPLLRPESEEVPRQEAEVLPPGRDLLCARRDLRCPGSGPGSRPDLRRSYCCRGLRRSRCDEQLLRSRPEELLWQEPWLLQEQEVSLRILQVLQAQEDEVRWLQHLRQLPADVCGSGCRRPDVRRSRRFLLRPVIEIASDLNVRMTDS